MIEVVSKTGIQHFSDKTTILWNFKKTRRAKSSNQMAPLMDVIYTTIQEI